MPDRCKLETEKSQLNELPQMMCSLPANLPNPRVSALPMPAEINQQVDPGKFTSNAEQLAQRMEQAEREQIGMNWAQNQAQSAIKDLKISSVVYRILKCSCKVATLYGMALKLYYLAGQEEGEAVVMGGLIGIRINVDLNTKVNISSGSQIPVYVFYYLCIIYIINL